MGAAWLWLDRPRPRGEFVAAARFGGARQHAQLAREPEQRVDPGGLARTETLGARVVAEGRLENETAFARGMSVSVSTAKTPLASVTGVRGGIRQSSAGLAWTAPVTLCRAT